MPTAQKLDLGLLSLRTALMDGRIALEDVIDHIYEQIARYRNYNVWIHVRPKEEILTQAKRLSALQNKYELPLFGIPYAVKDNIDVAGIPTTAGCEEFKYIPKASADVVKNLDEAGALMIGKTNLDQFATGLVGTRSPYGVVKNSFHPSYIAGGSSSGSAVAVSLGMASFSLGTDTAGSGRVPAGFNNVFGLKPTKGLISTKGVVPACKSIDCVSIFALNSEDASRLLYVAMDNSEQEAAQNRAVSATFTFAIPEKEYLNFSGNREYESLYYKGLDKLKSAGCIPREIDFSPFLETAALLYEGPWVAERLASIKDFFATHSGYMLSETRTIIGAGEKFTAVDTFLALDKLDELKTKITEIMKGIDLVVVPTTPTIYTIENVHQEPYALNKNLGYYTNFVNLLGLCALAVPNGFQSNGLPMGITLIARAHEENKLLQLGKLFSR